MLVTTHVHSSSHPPLVNVGTGQPITGSLIEILGNGKPMLPSPGRLCIIHLNYCPVDQLPYRAIESHDTRQSWLPSCDPACCARAPWLRAWLGHPPSRRAPSTPPSSASFFPLVPVRRTRMPSAAPPRRTSTRPYANTTSQRSSKAPSTTPSRSPSPAPPTVPTTGRSSASSPSASFPSPSPPSRPAP